MVVSAGLIAAGMTVLAASPPASAADSTNPSVVLPAAGQYVPMNPVRAVTNNSIAASGSKVFELRGTNGIPATGVGALALELTALNPTASASLVVSPASATAAPAISSLNFVNGQSETAFVAADLSPAGFRVWNKATKATSVQIDVVGYWVNGSATSAGDTYVPQAPQRLLTGSSISDVNPVVATVTGKAGVPLEDVDAVMVSANVFSTSATGRLLATADGVAATSPATSDLQFIASTRELNQFPVMVSDDGKLRFRLFTTGSATSVSASLTVDITGYFLKASSGVASGRTVLMAPTRAFSWTTSAAQVAAGATKSYTFTAGTGAVPVGSDAVLVDVTAQSATSGQATGLAAYPADADLAKTSTAYSVFAPNATLDTSLLVVKLGAAGTASAGQVKFQNTSAYAAKVYGDIVGYVTSEKLPSAPRAVSAVVGDQSATVSWKAPSDLGSPQATSYQVKAIPGNKSVTVAVPTQTAQITGLTNDAEYRFRVLAISTRGSTRSQPSAPVTPTEPLAAGQMDIGRVTTLAGTGQATTTVGSAAQTAFNAPTAVTAVGGTTYAGTADAIVAVGGNGSSSLLAGTPGTQGCSDTVPVTFQPIKALAADASFIYSASQCGLRRTSLATGTTVTLLSGNQNNLRSLTIPGDGYVYYLTSWSPNSVYRYSLSALTGAFWANIPAGCGGATGQSLASDTQYVYVTSYDLTCGQSLGSPRLSKIDISTGAPTTLATDPGLLTAGLAAVNGTVFFSSSLSTQSGNGVISSGPRLYRYNVATQRSRYLAGSSTGYQDGLAHEAFLGDTAGLALSGSQVVIADSVNNRIRLVQDGDAYRPMARSAVNVAEPLTRADIATVAGNAASVSSPGTGTAASFNAPRGVVTVGSTAYVSTADTIMKVKLGTGEVSVLAGVPGSPGYTDAPLGSDARVESGPLDYDGRWIYLLQSGRYRRVDPQTGAVSTVGGSSPYNIDTSFAVGPDGLLYGVASSLSSIWTVDPKTGSRSLFASFEDVGCLGCAIPESAEGIAVDGAYAWVLRRDANNTWATSYYVTRVSLANPSQQTSVQITPSYPYGSALREGHLASAGGSLYISLDINDGGSPATDTIKLLRMDKDALATSWVTGGLRTDADGVDGTFGDINQITSDGTNLYTVGASASGNRLRVIKQGPEPTAPGGLDGYYETAGGGNPSIPASATNCVCVGDPVQLNTGALVESQTDFDIPGRGPALKFTRTYDSSRASVLGRFGYGWTDSYDMGLTVDSPSTGYVTVRQENGSQVAFQSTSKGYVPSAETQASLVKNDDGTWTFTRARVMKFTFDSTGKLTRIEDLNGEHTDLGYNGSSQLTTITDTAGRALTLAYTSGRVTSIKDMADASQRTVSLTYVNNELRTVTDVNLGLTQFSYDASHRLTTILDPLYNGASSTVLHKVFNEYDASGRVFRQTDKRGKVTLFSYGTPSAAGYSTVTVTHPRGNVDEYQYRRGVLMAKTSGLGSSEASTETYEPDPTTLQPAIVADGTGAVTRYEYDGRGNPIVVTDPLGRSTRTDYDRYNNPTLVTDPANRVIDYKWDKTNLLSVTRTLEQVGQADQAATTIYKYTDAAHPGDLMQVIDPLNHATTYTYDQYGYRTSVTDATTRKWTTNYNSRGWVTSTVTAEGNKTGNVATEYDTVYSNFDKFGNARTVTDPYNKATTYLYNVVGWPTDMTDPDLNTTHTDYDADGRVVQVIRPNDTVAVPDRLVTTYDDNGNLWKQIDAKSKATTYGYDTLDRVTTVTDPLTRTLSTTSYDGASRPVRVTQPADGGGTLVTAMNYDKAGQLKVLDYSDATPDVSFDYDAVGRRVSMVDGTGPSTFTYDTLDRLTKVLNGAGAQVQYGYDLAGRLKSLTYPGAAGSVTYDYDDADRMAWLKDFGTRQTSFGYDDNGALKTTTYPNGVVATALRDRMGRVSLITDVKTATTLASFGYTYKDSSLLATGSQTGTPGADQTYGWTKNQQVQTVTGGTAGQGAGGYGFDLADNLTSLPGAAQSFDDGNQLLSRTPTSGAATTYGYTARGERKTVTTSGATDTLSWDGAGRLTWVAPAAGAAYSYGVDGSGLRSSVTAGGVTKQWTWDVGSALPQLLSDGDRWFIYGPGGVPVEQVDRATSAPSWLHQDALGSTRMLTDVNGAITATFAFTPFGQLAGKTGAGDTPLRFTGQYTDPTGYIYLRARVYDPATGVFLSRDPLMVITRDAYGYVAGNPLQRVDPTGLDWIQDAGDWAAGFGDAVTLGGTEWVREQLGVNDAVNKCSVFYDWGGNGGTVALYGTMVVSGASGLAARSVLPGLPASAPRVLGLGSTGRTLPATLAEQLAMTEVRSAPAGSALRVTGGMGDSRWPASAGWVKMQQIVNDVNIHYVRNTLTGAVDDFKFVGG